LFYKDFATLSQLQALTVGSHVFAIYANIKHELDECFAFLKAGFENGEAVWIAEEDLTKEQIRERIRKEWNLENVEELEARGDITITTSREWYYPDGNFNLEKVVAKWQKAVEDAVAHGKKGLRAFDAVDGLLKDGFADELVAFERVLGSSFKIPFTAICAYKAPDVADRMTAEQLSTLHMSHGLHRSFGYNVLENPLVNQHFALMYDNDQQRDAATTKYINEGLKRNQLCIYASVYMREKAHQERISSLIDNYAKNIAEDNLILIDSAPYYLAAMTDNFAPFEEIKEQIKSKAACRSDKHVRLADDCVAFLFKNKHFEECSRLEEWWHRKPFEGSYLCPYPNDIAAKYPYNIQKFRILSNHDLIANESGYIIAVYLSEIGRHGH
jgi:hypothetical protein